MPSAPELFEATPEYRLVQIESALYVDEHFDDSQGLAFHFEPEEPDDDAPRGYPLFPLSNATDFIATLIDGATQLGYQLQFPDEVDIERQSTGDDFDSSMN